MEFHALLYHAMNVCGTQSFGFWWVSGPGSVMTCLVLQLENRADSKVRFFPPHQRNYEGYVQALENPLWHRNF